MKNFKILIGLIVTLFIGAGCSSSMYQSSGYLTDDIYGTHNEAYVAANVKAKAEARKAAAEAREAQWQAELAEAQAQTAENEYESHMESTYDGAYERRIKGFESLSYKMPSSYQQLRYNNSFNYVTAYDPAFYNVVVMGDQVWVEPIYISSMFGSWGVANYNNGWYNNWAMGPQYSWYGYPRHSWWDWNYNMCYNPWYGPSWGRPYPGHYYPGHYYPGHYYPGHGSGSVHKRDIVRRSSAYTSPTSGRNFGSRSSEDIVNRRNTSSRPSFGVRGTTTSKSNNSYTTGSRSRNSSTNARNSNRGGTSQYRETPTRNTGNSYTPSRPTGGSRSSGGSNSSSGATGRNRGGR